MYAGTNGKRKRDEESSESEEEEAEDKTPKNKKVTTTPQTFPKANKKVRPARERLELALFKPEFPEGRRARL